GLLHPTGEFVQADLLGCLVAPLPCDDVVDVLVGNKAYGNRLQDADPTYRVDQFRLPFDVQSLSRLFRIRANAFGSDEERSGEPTLIRRAGSRSSRLFKRQ